MSLTPPDRRVITFYSYKGGSGRTMTMANVAYRLANTHGLNVIAVDWDLEAPGLHRFFGITPEVAAKTSGMLDYFIAWREAVRRKDPEPPTEVVDVSPWLVPITEDEHKPRFGAVSLLLAGKLDNKYADRLASLNWQDFYKKEAGAVAVEKLRDQLVAKADVVLIDSRTGLTDVGGICTVQIPDGVVLMAAPNRQSIDGLERVARALAKASIEDRAGRSRARVWIAISRVSSVDETYLAEQWFAEHKAWFDACVDRGLWLAEDHVDGIRSHMIPHRARWSFGEVVLTEATKVDANDPLMVGYEELTGTLLRWRRGEPPMSPEIRPGISAGAKDIEALQTEATDAETRGDMLGLALALERLAVALIGAARSPEAIRKLEQAIGIYLSRGARIDHARTLSTLGFLLMNWKRFDEAVGALEKAIAVAHEIHEWKIESWALIVLAAIRGIQGAGEESLRLEERAKRVSAGAPELSILQAWLSFALRDAKPHAKHPPPPRKRRPPRRS